MLVKPGEKWYTNYEPVKPEYAGLRVSRDKELALRKEAEELLQNDTSKYQNSYLASKSGPSSELTWAKSILSKGAFADKLAGHVLLTQNSPCHNLDSLHSLVQMTSSKGKRECFLSLDKLKELFITELLPSNRKLKPFAESVIDVPQEKPNAGTESRKRCIKLILAYYEDQLRTSYRRFVESVEKLTHDSLVPTKNKAINVLYELLKESPEQEVFLLSSLVNKMGDPSAKSSSHVMFLLKKLILEDHPAMKQVVVNEIERFIYRPNVSEKGSYYGILFLSEIILNSTTDKNLANKLIEIYFTCFKKLIKSGDVNNKMMAALLTGVSRSLPYSSIGYLQLADHLETFYKLIHYVNVSIAIQILSMIFTIITSGKVMKHHRMIQTLQKGDEFGEDERKHKKKKNTTLNQEGGDTIMFNIAQIESSDSHPEPRIPGEKKQKQHYDPGKGDHEGYISDKKPESTEGGKSQKQMMDRFYCVLLRFLLNSDVDSILTSPPSISHSTSVAMMHQQLTSKRSKVSKSSKRKSLDSRVTNAWGGACSKKTMLLNLLYRSIQRDSSTRGDGGGLEANPERAFTFIKRLLQVSLSSSPEFCCSILFLISKILKNHQSVSRLFYSEIHSADGSSSSCHHERGGEGLHVWELSLLSNHFHPSVVVFATHLKNGEEIKYDGDPLEDFTLKHFLDRFVYRNPKKMEKITPFSRSSVPSSSKKRRIDSKEYLDIPAAKIPPEEKFMHHYLKNFQVKNKHDDDDQSVDSDEFETILDRFECDFDKFDEDFE